MTTRCGGIVAQLPLESSAEPPAPEAADAPEAPKETGLMSREDLYGGG